MFNLFKKDRKNDIEKAVSGLASSLLNSHYNFTPGEITEIYNRVGVRIM